MFYPVHPVEEREEERQGNETRDHGEHSPEQEAEHLSPTPTLRRRCDAALNPS
jgi:hypothetical protein